VPPVSPTASAIAQAGQAPEQEQRIADLSAAAGAFRAAELEQQELSAAKAWANAELESGATCSGTSFASTQSYYEGSVNCSSNQIAQAGGFYGCAPGANPCSGDAWIPVGSQAAGFNSMTGSAFGPWGGVILDFLDGCWEGAVIAVEASPIGMAVACVAGGSIDVGVSTGVSKLAGG